MDLISRLGNFCKEKVSLPIVFICIIFSYALSFSYAIGIDDESVDFYLNGAIIMQNRVGSSLFNKVIPTYSYIPFLNSAIGVAMMTVGILLILFMLESKIETQIHKILNTLCICMFLTYPYIAKCAIFAGLLQTIGYVLVFTAFATWFVIKLWENSSVKYVAGLAFCIMCVLIFDKAYIVFLVQTTVFYLLLYYCDNEERCSIKKILKLFICMSLALLLGFIGAKIVVRATQIYYGVNANHYTDNYIKYDTQNMSSFITSIGRFLQDFWTTEKLKLLNSFPEKLFITVMCSFCVFVLYTAILKKDFLFFLIGFGNVMVTQSVMLVTGNIYMPVRSYAINYALFIVFAILIMCRRLRGYEHWIYLILVWALFIQTKEMEMIYYKKMITFEKDKRYAEDIIGVVAEECNAFKAMHKPIIFLGFPENEIASYGEVEETSIFIWDRCASVYNEEISSRLYRFYKELGWSIKQSDYYDIDYYDARMQVGKMESFPHEGCIKEYDNYILVKLGDSLCEILDLKSINNYNADERIVGNVEWFSDENQSISMGGWVLCKGENSYNNNISLVILNDENAYRMRVDERKRPDITNYFSDGKNYDNSGFNINMGLNDYIKEGEYHVYLEIRNGGLQYLFNAERTICVRR